MIASQKFDGATTVCCVTGARSTTTVSIVIHLCNDYRSHQQGQSACG